MTTTTEEMVTPRREPYSPADDDLHRAFIDGWNARLDHDEFDMALHYWMLASCTVLKPADSAGVPDGLVEREVEEANERISAAMMGMIPGAISTVEAHEGGGLMSHQTFVKCSYCDLRVVLAALDRLTALSARPSPPKVDATHPDDVAVDTFAAAMKAKLAAARAKGRGGWDDPAQCSVGYLRTLLHEHVAKGDPIDVANFCMMLNHYGASTTRGAEDTQAEVVRP